MGALIERIASAWMILAIAMIYAGVRNRALFPGRRFWIVLLISFVTATVVLGVLDLLLQWWFR